MSEARSRARAAAAAKARRHERRSQHQDLSRTQLLDAAEVLFGRAGFHETTLKEVADLAGFSVGSVYSFFENKDDLFRQVYLRRGNEFMEEFVDIVQLDAPVVDVLRAVVAFQVGFFRERPHFGRLYLFHSGHVFGSDANPPLDPAVIANFEEAMELQAGLFRGGQAAGIVVDGDPAVLSRLFSGIVAAYQETDPAVVAEPDGSVLPRERMPLASLQDIVVRAFTRPT